MLNDITQSSKVKEKKKEWIRTLNFIEGTGRLMLYRFMLDTKEEAKQKSKFSKVIKNEHFMDKLFKEKDNNRRIL